MTARLRKTVASFSLALLALSVACTSYTEIPIETPISPKLDVTPFQRVFIAGFIAGANEDVDANMETVRLLRSQLRNKELALERLVAALRDVLRVPRPRRPTRPHRGAVEERLASKRRRSRLKRLRGPADEE